MSRLLVREVGRSRSRLSVRQLLDDHGSDVQQVTPCFLMSPDSVARFLAPDGMRFDVVIFDEASQVRVAEAVGALGRGTSCVIVGDSRQMPPTSFGAVTSDSDQEVERVESLSVPEDEESILTECIAADLPRRWLSWHYRSQHESLIAFSNQHYYDGRLASFPSPVSHDAGTGVHLREVNGEFERGKARVNREEAQAVVEEIRTRLTSPETVDQSIGVVTFNIQQRDLIASMLEQLDDPAVAAALEKEPAERLFVKNLENVQGDERDVILFSLAFSKDPSTGRLPLQFGPLINNGGERRLNVAVTRARRLVILFTSFKPADIDPKRSSSVGLAHLRAYMEMAAAQQHTADDVSPTSSTRDLHREDVAEALRARGLRVQTEVGLSDFKVDLAVGLAGDGPWRMAVLLDGPPWARRQTVADRDGFPLSVLKGPMGWPDVARVWLPAWLSEREAVLDRLERAVREAEPVAAHVDASIQRADELILPADQQDGEETLVVGTRFSTGVDETTDAADDATLLGHSYSDQTELGFDYAYAQFYLDYVKAEETEPAERTFGSAPEAVLGSRSVLDGLSGRANRKVVLEAIEQALAVEGPMELGRLARNIGRRFDLNRMGDERIRAVLRLIPKERVTSDHLGTFVWPSELSPELWTGYHRQSSYLERQLPEISPQEIANVMRAHDLYFAEDDTAGLFRAVMEVFGYTRLTNAVSTRLEAVHLWRANR